MDQRTIQIFFALLRSAIRGTKLTEEEKNSYSPEMLQELLKLSSEHDIEHLLAYGLKQNGLIPKERGDIEKNIFKSIYRYERIKYEYENLCEALESAKIPFIPLKGSVIRKYYPDAWMRTSCDIDVLIHREDLERAILYLAENYEYAETDRSSHDVSLYSPSGIHVELHFDLVEEGRANNAIEVLQRAWDYASLRDGSGYWYETSDDFFYFYHIAHMAKHFETGGCGVRTFIDLWILDRMEGADVSERDRLLDNGGLLKFAEASRKLSKVWFDGGEADGLLLQLQDFILHGGIYGTIDNRVALQQTNKGGRLGYMLSRIFIPFAILKRHYPILEKHPYLMPFMQIRRWFRLLNPSVAKKAKYEMAVSSNLEKEKAGDMNAFLKEIGL